MIALRGKRRNSRLRLVQGPRDDRPVLSGVQIWIGRRLGAVVIWRDEWRERRLIWRSQSPERGATRGILGSLVGAQRGLLLAIVVTASVTIAIDILLDSVGSSLLPHVPWHAFLRDNLSLPPASTLNNTLIATAAATGTILGLVLSVSLIVFQTTAERYRQARIVQFLLRERVGSTVVRLLVTAFLYSLLLLLLSGAFSEIHFYVGTTVAVLLTAAGVVSLIPYRVHALSGYLPGRLFDELTSEVARELWRAARPSAGRSVQGHSQRVVAQDLATLTDLVDRIVTERDETSIASGLRSMQLLLDRYIPAKRRLRDDSFWFPRRPQRMAETSLTSIADHFAVQGLMAPTSEEPDRDWLETAVLKQAVRPLRDTLVPEKAAVWEQLMALYLHAWQHAWAAHEFDVADLVLDEIEPLFDDPRVIGDPVLVEQLDQAAWLVLEVAGQGLSSSAAEIVAQQPWTSKWSADGLPRLAAEQALKLRDKIELEVAVTGSVQTPEDRMLAELQPIWADIESEYRERYVARSYGLARRLLANTAETRSDATPAAAEMYLRIVVRSVERGVARDIDNEIITDFQKAVFRADTTAYASLRETLQAAIRRLSEGGHWDQVWRLLTPYIFIALRRDRRDAGEDQNAAMVATFDAMFLVAHAYGWAEFRQEADATERAMVLLEAVLPLDAFKLLVGDHLASTLMLPFDVSVKYGNWFQTLRTAAYELPERWEDDGGFGYDTVRDHPSDLFRTSGLLGVDNDSALEHMVRRLDANRSRALERLLQHLRARQDQLGERGSET